MKPTTRAARSNVIAGFVLLMLASRASASPPGTIPTVEYEARGAGQSPNFVVFVTGDGGWRRIDVKVSNVLRDAGMPVVGLLANSYFVRRRTPDQASADLDRLIREYSEKWQRSHVVLVGYSRGADALPFMINRLPAGTRQMITLVALLGPAEKTSMVIGKPEDLSLLGEVQPLSGMWIVCVAGTLEKHSLCPVLPTAPTTAVVTLRGGHHFGGRYGEIGRAILDALKRRG